MSISLHNIKMTVIQTAENGVVNNDTIFDFTQTKNFVIAEYKGGRIRKGLLAGVLNGNELKFRYCQIQTDNKFDNGISTCELTLSDNGKIRLIEHFEWKSRQGEWGTNIFEEI